jgi:hypothetical protein
MENGTLMISTRLLPATALVTALAVTMVLAPTSGAADTKSSSAPAVTSKATAKAKRAPADPGHAAPNSAADAAKSDPKEGAAAALAVDAGKDKPKSDTAAAAAPPTAWSEAEIAEAKAHCEALLKDIDVVVVPHEPIRHGACGAPAPVTLIAIGKVQQVSFSPPPTLTCEMVKSLHSWFKGDLQKIAQTHLGAPSSASRP